jgi:hypothetical protein
MSTAGNPLFGNPSGINMPPPGSPVSPTSTSSPISLNTPNLNPGGLANPTSNIKDIQRNTGLENLTTGDFRNQLIQQFAKLFGQYGTNAGDFFKMLMDKGSPFYQQRQAEAFTAGNKSNQDAAAQARQQAEAAGTGFTPSGTNVAMIGGMNTAGSQNLAEQFLQNLFQNENLMVTGAQGEAQVANMFNPSAMTGQNTPQPGSTQGPNVMQDISGLLSALGISGKAGPVGFGG